MSFDEVLKVMLPKQANKSANITGHYGEHRAKGPHGGTDFNYVGGQSGINLDHPAIHSPVTGKVEFVGGQYGTIKIRDAEGNSHEILHTHAQSVVEGQRVEVGQIIGTMGGRGPRGSEQYAQHVHYQLRDSQGRLLSPENFWNHRSVTQQQAPAMADGLLKVGERGQALQLLQESLVKLGYDAEGRGLKADGHSGAGTEEALRAFQRDHGLVVDGAAGLETLQALKRAERTPLLTDRHHADHALFLQAQAGVHKLDAQRNRTPDILSDQLAAALVVAAKREGLTRIDEVILGKSSENVIVRQSDRFAVFDQFAHVNTVTGLNQSVARSSEQLVQVNQEQVQQTMAAEQQRQQTSERSHGRAL